MNWPLVSTDPVVQFHYEECRRVGTSHSLAEMFALGQTPSVMTDSVFLAGKCNGSQFEKAPGQGDFYKHKAGQAGVDTTGKVYLSSLAAFPGDPEAWVSGRGDVQRVLEQRGWECEGAVNVKGEVRHEHKPVGLAEDLVLAEVRDVMEKTPEADPVAVRDEVVQKRKPHWSE